MARVRTAGTEEVEWSQLGTGSPSSENRVGFISRNWAARMGTRCRVAGGAGGASPSLRWVYLLTRRLGPDIRLKIVTRTPDAEMSGGLQRRCVSDSDADQRNATKVLLVIDVARTV